MKKSRLILIFALAFAFLFVAPGKSNATYCTSTTINGTCEFANAKDGFDSGNATNDQPLTVSSGTLVIGGTVENQELAVGKLILSGGAVTIYDGAKLRLGAKIWMVDQDADGYPSTTTQYIQEAAPTNGRRKSAMRSPIQTDCDDYSDEVHPQDENTVFRTTAIVDVGGTSAKNGTYDYNCDNAITKQYTSAAAYSCDTTGCAAHYYTVVSGWADGSNPTCGTTEAYYVANYGTCAALSSCSYQGVNYTQGCY